MHGCRWSGAGLGVAGAAADPSGRAHPPSTRGDVGSPAPIGAKVLCTLARRRTRFAGVVSYDLFLEQPEREPRLVLSARKVRTGLRSYAFHVAHAGPGGVGSSDNVVAHVRCAPHALTLARTA